jgi:hypothetical protein
VDQHHAKRSLPSRWRSGRLAVQPLHGTGGAMRALGTDNGRMRLFRVWNTPELRPAITLSMMKVTQRRSTNSRPTYPRPMASEVSPTSGAERDRLHPTG